MRFALAKRESGLIEFGIIYGTIALLVLLAARFLPVQILAPDCVFRSLTGLPCPTCGSTRSVVCLAHGDLAGALALNPLALSVFLLAIVALLHGVVTLLFGLRRITCTPSETEKKYFPLFLTLILLANWTYLLFTLH